MKSLLLIALCVLARQPLSYHFPFEADQLTPADTEGFPGIAFGDTEDVHSAAQDLYSRCRAFPGERSWPPEEEWNQLNKSLGGALLKPPPPGVVCYSNSEFYDQAACNNILTSARSSRLYIDDPVSGLTVWAEGRTCLVGNNTQGNCTQGGFPVYVVNATTVKHVQIAVNFARNRNMRLVVKNTGHDFIGRSVGAGSLSVWTHHLKDFEFIPQYEQGGFREMAARVSSGLESWEMFSFMERHNMTLVVPSDSTVGAYGGWMTGGGHSPVASLYGLGADQPLSLQVVTADGRFVTADPETNSDLYYALRGGGPGEYCAFITPAEPTPHLSFNSVTITFATPGNGTLDAFWRAFAAENQFGKRVTEKPYYGTGYSYVSGNNSTAHFSYTTTYEFPNKSFAEITALITPHIDELARLGISITVPQPIVSTRWADTSRGRGDVPGNSVFASRLFSMRDWEDPLMYADVVAALRYSIEAGHQFHGIHLAPTEAAAAAYGPGAADNAVSAAWRRATMHADLFDRVGDYTSTKAKALVSYARFNESMARWRAAAPDGGVYVNEADLLEPHWQQAFWGDKYPGLLAVKRKYDPWDLFWAPNTVGSEDWAVETGDFLPSQNGRLCRVSWHNK
ncbi:hypothetical protein PG993_004654 [Apiospora rasikravindrae]|uniref:FAD-binding PCMH-type domain-containing protein n=1 Tax=Apiospora rasikravindrae TaxID=990691 RepID=A0ABR1TFE4_9PEZI